MGLGVLKKIVLLSLGSLLLTAGVCVICAKAEEAAYPLIYGEAPKDGTPVLELREAEGEYTVQPGDSLWSIANKLWGEGSRYRELFSANREILSVPELIYPGMSLQTARAGYIYRKGASQGGVSMGEYSLDLPSGWTVGTLSSGEAFANFALSGSGVKAIACLIQDKKKETVDTLMDWEGCRRKIQGFGEKNYGDAISDISFSHYCMEEGEEVYLYAFNYRVNWEDSGRSRGADVRVCAGMKLTEHLQAEFLGFALDYDIEGCVRYVTASFEEHSDFGSGEEFTVNDSNMAITPGEDWELKGMFNSFAWVKEFFDSLLGKETKEDASKGNPRQSLMDRMSKRVS